MWYCLANEYATRHPRWRVMGGVRGGIQTPEPETHMDTRGYRRVPSHVDTWEQSGATGKGSMAGSTAETS